MNRKPRTWIGAAMAVIVPLWLLGVPASAAGQHRNGSRGSGSHTSGGSQRGGAQGSGARSDGARRGSSHDGNSRAGASATPRGSDRGASTSDTPRSRRPSDDSPAVGRAVPRVGPPPDADSHRDGRGGTVVVPGYVPWGFGVGLGYYDPWDPWGVGYGYGGYYRGAPLYVAPTEADSTLRLKVRPRDASVYVDGYYAGVVDDFDGVFQKLHLESGPHRIEIHAPGYDTLALDMLLVPDHKTTYTGELKEIQ